MLNNFVLARKTSVVDADVFADLYREYTYGVYNYCLFRVGNGAVAEDLTADTFERAWRARHRYQPERAKFNTWLFTIARRVVTDWQRRQTRRTWLPLNPGQPDEASSPEARFEESEAQARLRDLVQSLKTEEQELIALKFGAGMTNREIAVVIDKSETAVGSAVYRIMQKLRAQWEETE